jgi:hypothetical protein
MQVDTINRRILPGGKVIFLSTHQDDLSNGVTLMTNVYKPDHHL